MYNSYDKLIGGTTIFKVSNIKDFIKVQENVANELFSVTTS